jgi:cell division protein FtsQ
VRYFIVKYKVIFNLFLLLVVLPTVVGFSLWSLEQNGFFKVESVQIQISSVLDQKNYVKTYAENLEGKLEFLKGTSLWKTDLSKVSEILRKEKWIKEFRISRDWPATVRLEVESQEIAFLFSDSAKKQQGLLRPVNMNGDLLPEIDTRQAPARALLKGEIFIKNPDKRKKAIELLKSLPSEGKMSFDQLSEINYDSKEGFWITMIHSDLKVQLGEDQFAMKSARVSQVLDYLENKNLKARVIDANLSKKVLVRLQQNP